MKIEKDKWKHFYVGIAMGLLFQWAGWYFLPNHFLLTTIAAFVIVVAISYGFELFSLVTGKGHYEVMDAVAAIIGGVIGMGIIMLFTLL